MTSEPLDICPGCYGRMDADDDRCPSCDTSLGERSAERDWIDVAWPGAAAPRPGCVDDEDAERRLRQEVADAVS